MNVELRNTSVPVIDCADVLVVGGGPAGFSAAVAAARAGAEKVILVERYPYLGGMATGGRVVLIPSISYKENNVLTGITEEILDKLHEVENGIYGPQKVLTGNKDPQKVKYWSKYLNMVWNETICYGGFTDPDVLRIVLQEKAEAAGVELYYNCWGSEAILENKKVKGICFESKQGRGAILADVTIDCTGDADIAYSAGVECEYNPVGTQRNTSMGLVYRLGGADFDEYSDYKENNPEDWSHHAAALTEICGFATAFFPTSRNSIVWADNWVTGGSCLKIKDLASATGVVTEHIFDVIKYLRENKIPGLNSVWLYDIAPQVGTRGSRRIHGKTFLTMEDVKKRTEFKDVVAVFPAVDLIKTNAGLEDSSKTRPLYFPLSAMQPEACDNLCVAGRAFSSDMEANNLNSLIPHCMAMGQAAGVWAACASKNGTLLSETSYEVVKKELLMQNVYLPE